MITKFNDVEVKKEDNILNIYLDVEFLNQPKTIDDPVMHLMFDNGKFVDANIKDNSFYDIDEVDKFQAMHYLSQLSNEEIERLLFGG